MAKRRYDLVKHKNTVNLTTDEVANIKAELQTEAMEIQKQWHGILETYALPNNATPEEIAYSVCGNEQNFKMWSKQHGAKQLLTIDNAIEKVFAMLGRPDLNVFDISLISNALKSLSTSYFNMQKVMYDIIGIAKLEGKVEVNVHSPAEKYTQNIVDMANDEELMNTRVIEDADFEDSEDDRDDKEDKDDRVNDTVSEGDIVD